MVIDSKQRALERLSYLFYLKDKNRSSEENWAKAQDFLKKLEKRYKR